MSLRKIIETRDLMALEAFCQGRTYQEVRNYARDVGIDLDELEGLLEEFKMREIGDTVPVGYNETIDCMNQPKSWDVPGMIADIAENVRCGNNVANGQLLAALDWMSFRLRECRAVLVAADSELSAVAHGRPVDKEESQKISRDARSLCEALRGFNAR